ncbi:MAG: metallophosphoesterase [Candidatus Acidiferrales bacterium]
MSPRSKWKKRVLATCVVVCVTAAGLAVWAFWIEPSRLVVKRVTLEWKPEAGRGLRIALVSDLHVGSPHVGLERLSAVVEMVNRESPDLILLAGDFVVGKAAGEAVMESHVFAPELGKLRARLGVVAVLGNHDWWYLGGKVQRDLRAHGITVLHNQAVPYETPAGKLWVAGLGELWVKMNDISATLRDVPEGAPVILLTHNPDIFPGVPADVNLVLAGHTHGGQVKFPFIGAPVVPSQYGQRYVAGYIEENGRRMFVTTGVGTSILPVRFGVPPEIVILTLGERETQNLERRTQN